MSDAYVITRLCRDCVDGACVAVCPVECIYQHDGGEPLPNQLFIDPEDCISCGLCEPACPWEAIVASDRVPLEWQSDIELNALRARRPEEFSVPVSRLRERAKPVPAPDAISANRLKWSTRAA